MDHQLDQLKKAEGALAAARNDHESAYAAEIKKLDDMKKKLLDRLLDLNEKKRHCFELYGNDNVSDDDLVEVNAGGKIIAARRGVLRQLKGTRFEALFSGRWDKKLQRDSSGRIFLDINPKAFRSIVDYLNELSISAQEEQPDSPWKDDGEMSQFFSYFGLHKCFFVSNIIEQPCHFKLIHQWLNEDGSDGDLKLIYRASRDNFSNEAFHNKCDKSGPTLIVLKTEQDHVLGGYTNTPWQSSGIYLAANGGLMKADKAFLFALEGFGITAPIKMTLKDADGYAIHGNKDYGPIFGNNNFCDMFIKEACVTLKNANNSSYDNIPWGARESYNIKEMEVYQVVEKQLPLITSKDPPKVDRFTKEVNDAINEKWKSLNMLEAQISSFEESVKDEEYFIESSSLTNDDGASDIITLNVSGTMMATKRATLRVIEDSVLAQQFDDTKWTQQGNGDGPKVKEWTPDDVTNWANSIEGIPDDVAGLLCENEINGLELLALNENGLKMLGVERVGTICLIADEIKSLKEKVNQEAVTFIEHSPYCFGKILDHLRLKRLQSIDLAEEPAPPNVCESQQKRFEKVVKYYFPGETSSMMLGNASSKFDDPESLREAIIQSFRRRPDQYQGVLVDEIFTDCHSQGYFATFGEVQLAIKHLSDQGHLRTDDGEHLRCTKSLFFRS